MPRNCEKSNEIDTFEELKEIVLNYVEDMEIIHEKRVEFAEKDLRLVQDECTAFNILRNRLLKFEDNVLPEDTFFVQA